MCRSVATNAECYMTLENTNGLGQRYKAKILIPTGTLLAVYSGSLERVQPGEEDSLNHSMAQGKVDFQYDLLVNGTPRPGDTRPGRLQMVNHCCEPGNTAVCEEWSCDVTGLIAYFLRSKQDISPNQEVTFPYQTPTFKKGVQVYPARHFWKKAASLPPVKKGRHLVLCNCAGAPGLCPNGYGRHERILAPLPPPPPSSPPLPPLPIPPPPSIPPPPPCSPTPSAQPTPPSHCISKPVSRYL